MSHNDDYTGSVFDDSPLDRKMKRDARKAALLEKFGPRFGLCMLAIGVAFIVATGLADNWSALFGTTPTLNELQEKNPGLLKP